MIPEIDKLIGIEVYSTDLKGIGGRIKSDYDSFIVEEIINNIKFLDKGYALYRLEKVGIDSNNVINDIEKKYNLSLKLFGLKDANARTIQYVLSKRRGEYKEVIDKNYSLKFIGYTSYLTRDHLAGNRFRITVSDANATKDHLESFKKEVDKIANFYGYQRFGSNKPITHIIGRYIIKRNFKEAVELLSSNNKGFEYYVRKEYTTSKDPIKALRRVPIRIRRLFIDAYKAYIFNRTLSNIIKSGYDLKPKPNDICFIFDRKNRLGTFDEKYASILAIPTVGYGYKSKNRFAKIIDDIMREEGINHKDFYIKEMQEISSSSGFRQALLYCNEFNYTLEPLTLVFTLQVGGYATIFLRELMKPKDPIASGF